MQPTFSRLLHSLSEKYADEVLIYDTSESRSLTYADCFSLTEIVSGRLTGLGYGRGDIVANYCSLSLESVILCWACLRNGIIFLPVDHNWPDALLKQVLAEASPVMLLTDEDGLDAAKLLLSKGEVLVTGYSDIEGTPSFFNWLEDTEDNLIENIPEQAGPEDPAIILYTSGSTGIPKGVVLSQYALYMSGSLVADHFEWEKGDTFMNLGDLHSMSGLRNSCIAPLIKGSSVLIASEEQRNAVLHIIDLVKDLNIQYVGIAPTMIRQLNLLYSEVRKEQLSPLKAFLCTAGPLAKDQLMEFYEKYGIPVYNYYGLTETAGICSGHNASTFSPDDNSIGVPVGSEFILLPDVNYDDPDIGELVVHSDHLMSGYYKRKEETAAVLKEDGFHTGDIVRKRSDGCFELLGRKKNFIKSIYAELIHLEEIDQAMELHPEIKEACAVRYAEHAEDEKIVVFIVSELADKTKEKELVEDLKMHMNQKVGKRRSPWCYIFKNKLPRNSPGKIERQKLADNLDELIKTEYTRYF